MRFLVANLKMNLVSGRENSEYASKLAEALKNIGGDVSVIICPSFSFVPLFVSSIRNQLFLGAQNVAHEDRGAFTGEVSPISLREQGVTHVIVGHSERREYCRETDEDVRGKIGACIRNGLSPIVCVGESESERENGETFRVIRGQLESAFQGVLREDFRKVIIAYEPRWSIGTGRIPSSNEILEVVIAIRKHVARNVPSIGENSPPILYGGSVTTNHIDALIAESGISGVLIGREGLRIDDMVSIVKKLSE